MTRREILEALERMAVLLELDGANQFKARAFVNASRALDAAGTEPAELVENGTLRDIKGIGASIAEFIESLVKSGAHPDLTELTVKIPAGLMEMTTLTGFGAKKARKVWQELNIVTLADLKKAAEERTLASLDGFGDKSCSKILDSIVQRERNAGRHRLDVAREAADELLAFVRSIPSVQKAEAAGSLRRWKESVADLDVVAVATDAPAVMHAFNTHPNVLEVLAAGPTKSSVRLKPSGMQADLRVVTAVQFPHTMQHFTGSKEHNIELRARAKTMGLKVNEYGLFPEGDDNAKSLECADEAAIYAKLGLAYIPPELREGQGEIQWAEKNDVPKLLEQNMLRGTLHVHSTWSDGAHSIRQMAQTCHQLGLQYLGMADHSQAAAYAGGLSPDRVRQQWDEIDRLNDELANSMDGFRILKGIEADILQDGRLDYDGLPGGGEELWKGFDFIVASVHSSFSLPIDEQTDRVLRVLDNPYVSVLGHPTGRLITQREGYAIHMEKVIEKAAALGVAIEINAHPHRLDIDWRWGKKAREAGLYTSIDPDSHHMNGLADIEYGVAMARKAAWPIDKIITTWSADEVIAFAKKRRTGQPMPTLPPPVTKKPAVPRKKAPAAEKA